MAPDLRRNADWTLRGQTVHSACQGGGFAVSGRLAGPQELGRPALAFAPIVSIMLFRGPQILRLRLADAAQRQSFGNYLPVGLACQFVRALIVHWRCLHQPAVAKAPHLADSAGR